MNENEALPLPVFQRQLLRWTWICPLNAAPCFFLALVLPGFGPNLAKIGGMVAAIATFVLVLAVLTTMVPPLADPRHLLARSLSAGLKIRAWMWAGAVVCLPFRGPFLIPDLYCGMLAVGAQQQIHRLLGIGLAPSWRAIDMPGGEAFINTWLISMITGCLLMFTVAAGAFIALIFLQAKARRDAFRRPDATRIHGI